MTISECISQRLGTLVSSISKESKTGNGHTLCNANLNIQIVLEKKEINELSDKALMHLLTARATSGIIDWFIINKNKNILD